MNLIWCLGVSLLCGSSVTAEGCLSFGDTAVVSVPVQQQVGVQQQYSNIQSITPRMQQQPRWQQQQKQKQNHPLIGTVSRRIKITNTDGIIIAASPPSFSSSSSGRGVSFTNRQSQPFYSSAAAAADSAAGNYEKRTVRDFKTRDSRLGFIRKVYAIFGCQVLATICITAVIMQNRGIASLLLRNFNVLSLASFGVSMAVVTALVSSPKLRHTAPTNFLLLSLQTLSQALVVGTFSSALNPAAVCIGSMHTLVAFLSITLYSLQPNPQLDLSVLGNGLLAATTSLLLGSVLSLFFRVPMLDNLLGGALAVLFAAYLFYDTKKIVEGNHHNSYGQKEYILAALNLYQDVVNLFIQIMHIIDRMDRRRNSD